MKKARLILQPETFDIGIAAAAAFAAQRANGGLQKTETAIDVATGDIIRVTPNKTLIRQHLTNEQLLVLTDTDREQATSAAEAIRNYIVMKTLQESRISDFDHSLNKLLNQQTMTLRDCGLIAYLPETHAKILAKDARENTLTQLVYSSQHVGQIGSTLEFVITVLDKKYVRQFSCWHVFGYGPDGNCIAFFTSKEDCTTSGNYRGKVKRHLEDNYRNGVRVTEFNYVKHA